MCSIRYIDAIYKHKGRALGLRQQCNATSEKKNCEIANRLHLMSINSTRTAIAARKIMKKEEREEDRNETK